MNDPITVPSTVRIPEDLHREAVELIRAMNDSDARLDCPKEGKAAKVSLNVLLLRGLRAQIREARKVMASR